MSISQGYNPPDMGEIPEEWNAVNLKDVLLELTNGTTSYQSDDETDYPVTRIETISDGVINPDKVKFLVSISKQDLGKYSLRNGDILFSHINSIKHIAKTAIYEGNPPLLIHGMNLLLLRPNREKVYPRFLLNLLKFERTRNKFRSLAKKAINQASINQKEVGSVKIPLPPLIEQRKIARIISSVDDSIQKTNRIIENVEMLKRGLTQRLLSRGIGHTKFKKTELGEIPEEWLISKLENACLVVTIGVVNPATPYYTTPDKGVPYFRTQNVRENRLEPTEIYVTKDFNHKHRKSTLRENDILTIQTGFIGTSCLVPKQYEGANCHSLLITRTNDQILNPVFLCQLLNSSLGHQIISKFAQIGERGHLLLGDFRVLRIPLPPIPEQRKIASILSAVDDKIAKEMLRRVQLEQLKKGLMQGLLTGRVRVKVA